MSTGINILTTDKVPTSELPNFLRYDSMKKALFIITHTASQFDTTEPQLYYGNSTTTGRQKML